jgi:hypothetical protein
LRRRSPIDDDVALGFDEIMRVRVVECPQLASIGVDRPPFRVGGAGASQRRGGLLVERRQDEAFVCERLASSAREPADGAIQCILVQKRMGRALRTHERTACIAHQ